MRSHRIEAYPIPAIKDEVLPNVITGLPFDSTHLDEIMQDLPTLITGPASPQDSFDFNPQEKPVIYMDQPTGNHGHSFVLDEPKYKQPWHDEYGNFYQSLSIKGTNFSNPEVFQNLTAATGYVAYGLQESIVSRRVARASRLLRENGIGTEYMLRMAEPTTLPWPDHTGSVENVPLAEYKRRIVESHWAELPAEERTPEKFVEVSRAFEGMAFFASLRATDTAYRVEDLKIPSAREILLHELNSNLDKDQTPFKLEKTDDYDRFNTEILAPRLATNLAKLHKLGLCHKFINGLNVTALGSIVDLDSVHGEALQLGDELVTDEDIVRDILLGLDTIGEFGLSVLSDKSGNPQEIFLDTYLCNVLEEVNSAEAMYTCLSRFLLANEKLKESDEDFRPNSNSHQTFFRYITDTYYDNVTPHLLTNIIETLQNPPDDFIDHAKAKLAKNIPNYTQLLMGNYLNEILADPDFDIASTWLKDPFRTEDNVAEWMAADIIEEAKIYCYGGSMLPGVLNLLPKMNLTRDQHAELLGLLYYDVSDMPAYDAAAELLSGWLPNFESELRRYFSFKPAELFIEDEDATIRFRTKPGLLMMETGHIDTDQIITMLSMQDKNAVEILPYKRNLDFSDNYRVSEGYYVAQIVSSNYVDGMYFDDGEWVTKFGFDMPDGDYILFIERNEQDEHKFRLVLEDIDLAAAVQDLPIDKALEYVRQRLTAQQQLFDRRSVRIESRISRALDLLEKKN